MAGKLAGQSWRAALDEKGMLILTNHVKSVWADFLKSSGLEGRLFDAQSSHVQSVTPGRVTLAVDLTSNHTNRLGTLHGGTIASLVDTGGSLALASQGMWATGVSTDINVTYIKSGGKPGNKIQVVCECDKMGRKLAFTRTSLYANGEEEPFARGSHTKFIEQANANEKNITSLVKEMVEKAKQSQSS